jgi:hypothetical protein
VEHFLLPDWNAGNNKSETEHAAYNPAQSWKLLAEAEYWEHLAEAELSSHFEECNPTGSRAPPGRLTPMALKKVWNKSVPTPLPCRFEGQGHETRWSRQEKTR